MIPAGSRNSPSAKEGRTCERHPSLGAGRGWLIEQETNRCRFPGSIPLQACVPKAPPVEQGLGEGKLRWNGNCLFPLERAVFLVH